MNNYDHLILQFLNLKPKDIESIHSATDDNNTLITITLKKKAMTCPVCGSVHSRSKGRYYKHIKLSHFTFRDIKLILSVRRYFCLDCHKSFSDIPTITPLNGNISYEIVNSVMELMKNPEMTFRATARILGISESSVIRIFDKFCHLPHKPLPKVICMDEVYCPNTDFKSKYICVIYDFMKHNIYDVLPDRKKKYLQYYLQSYSREELNSVQYVSIDMYYPYKQIAEAYFKKAVICADSFHVIKHLNDDLSQIRIRIMKSYPTDSIEYYLLKRFRFLLFDRTVKLDNKGKYNKRLGRYINYRQLLDMILSIHKDLEIGYELKEKYIIFNNESSYEEAAIKFSKLKEEFIKSNIPEYEDFISVLDHWEVEIINSFITYEGRRINNGLAESINANIGKILYNTRGIKNNKRRRKRIIYTINKNEFIR